ncbi:LysR family transcriptional regulator [Oceanobacillus sp. FSL K6-0251]|uniref:LysR family transcriptional regulator n=1 Tax=Oceanobacillus sp. FSL K6-0251 TaxID=2921602 RepID=UPI0030FC9BD5
MNLKHLQYFRELAHSEHLTNTANKLSISQPTLSYAITELEKHLGVYLFEKQGRNIRLTKYGHFFLEYAERSLAELERGEKKLRELTSPSHGVIDLAFIYTLGPYFIPEIIKNFSEQGAYKNISFSFYHGTTKNIIQNLKENMYDIAFCSMKYNEPDIEFTPVAEQELVLIVSENHPLADRESIDLEETASYPYVYFNQNSGLRPIVDELFHKVNLTPEIICEVEEDNAMAGLVAANYGIAVIPNIGALSHFPVKVINIKKPVYHRFIYMAARKNDYLSPATSAFRSFVISYCQKHYLKTKNKVE